MGSASLYLASPELSETLRVMARRGGENFTVAACVLSQCERRHLLAVYGFARLVDEIGDEYQGDRLAALDWLEGETRPRVCRSCSRSAAAGAAGDAGGSAEAAARSHGGFDRGQSLGPQGWAL